MNINLENLIIPEVPGVYIFKDSNGRILYIGKSNNLKERVKSYFQDPSNLEYRKRAMIDKVVDIEYIKCSSELESTLKEASLIRDLQPQYNAALKDNKSFPLITIIKTDDFPYIALKRESDVDIKDFKGKAEYFGPIKNSKIIRDSIQVLQSIFKFRTCDLEIFEHNKNRRFFKPCLLYYIKMCTAPCAAKINKDEYVQNIEQFKRFLNGDSEKLIKNLEQMMKYYSKNLQFEKAANLRDKISALKSINERMNTVYYHTDTFILTKINPSKSLEEIRKLFNLSEQPKIIDGIDISNIRGQYATGSIVRFTDGFPDKSGYRRYRIKTIEGSNDLLMMKEVITRRLARLIRENEDLPDILLIDGGLAHLNLVEKIIKEFKCDIFLIALAKYNKDHFYTSNNKEGLQLNPKNIATQLLTFIRDESHRFAQNYHKILRRKSIY